MNQVAPFRRTLAVLSVLGATTLLSAWLPGVGAERAGAADTTTTTGPTTESAPTAAAKVLVPVSARNFAFGPSKLTIASGQRVTIALKSLDGPHDFVVNGPGVANKKIVKVSPGKTAKGKLVLPKPGTYQFYCSLPGHRAAGMHGTITVT